MVPANSTGISPVPAYSGYPPLCKTFRYGAFTRYGPTSQTVHVRCTKIVQVLLPRTCRNMYGLGCSAFARHYSRNHCCFLLLWVLRCFSSPRSPPFIWISRSIGMGCPIRTSADHVACADPRSFSQLGTSFFASESLGIPRAPLFTCSCFLLYYLQYVKELCAPSLDGAMLKR